MNLNPVMERKFTPLYLVMYNKLYLTEAVFNAYIFGFWRKVGGRGGGSARHQSYYNQETIYKACNRNSLESSESATFSRGGATMHCEMN